MTFKKPILSKAEYQPEIVEIIKNNKRTLLAAIRLYNDISQQEMADILEMNVGEYTFLEDNPITYDMQQYICTKLGFAPDVFQNKFAFRYTSYNLMQIELGYFDDEENEEENEEEEMDFEEEHDHEFEED